MACPSSVNCTGDLARSNKRPPTVCSSRWTALVKAGWLTKTFSDAHVKFSVSATAKK